MTQPPIPGTVLLFTSERLRFRPGGDGAGVLTRADGKYLIIDGQHRLAALQFYLQERPDDAATINVPCVIFDGRSEDFATEMFVIINSTPTRINKSHLVDLYERVSWADARPEVRGAAGRHALQRGRQPAALPHQPARRPQPAGEVDPAGRALQRAAPLGERPTGARSSSPAALHGGRATTASSATSSRRRSAVFGEESWGKDTYMVTKPVTLKAMIRVCADLAREDAEPEDGRLARWEARLGPGRTGAPVPRRRLLRALPRQGPGRARGARHRELARAAGIEAGKKA